MMELAFPSSFEAGQCVKAGPSIQESVVVASPYLNHSTRKPLETTSFEFATEGAKGAIVKDVSVPNQILKPVRRNEFTFYETIYPQYASIRRFAPQYYGFEVKDGRNYVRLEDLTSPFSKSNMMDIKMGITTAGEQESAEKKESRKIKDGATTSVSLGMRYCGIWLYDPETKSYFTKDKDAGKACKPSEFESDLEMYISNQGRNSIPKRLHILRFILDRLRSILDWMENQPDFRMYSSSLLFLYEGNNENDYRCDVRMIDFSHLYVITDGRKDEGYLKGLRNLIQMCEEMRQRYSNHL